MTRSLLLASMVLGAACAEPSGRGGGPSSEERARWESRAQAVTIVRDDWGIAHVRANTDANAVFGMIYAQAEDDFKRVEHNYLNSMGRLAEAEGEKEIWRDLRMKLFIDPDSIKAKYSSSPDWLKTLMDAWADGLNYYLATHPAVKPRVITWFEPWMALTFSEGSIGGDIESVDLRELEAFYGGTTKGAVAEPAPLEPSGSNGLAIGPSRSASGRSLLLINPHTTFFFRDELQVTSDEGLNVYGAATWGQFFIYQGFNERAGWMHTSSGVDQMDEYAETVVEKNGGRFYRYGAEERPLATKRIVVPFRTDTGLAKREFTVYRSHHGPIVRAADGKWIAIKLMEEPVKALTQSFSRTKAKNYTAFKATMELHTNSSNNTVFADAEGNIAYFHANFVPKRDPRFDWTRPVDGSDPATEWQGLHSVDESPNVLNPKTGWIQNTNNWPYSAAGPESPKEKDYPPYMDRAGEDPRGVHAIEVLSRRNGFTLATLIEAAYDPHLTMFERLLPPLFKAYDGLPASDPQRAKLAEPIAELRRWDRRWTVGSIPTSVASFMGEELIRLAFAEARAREGNLFDYLATQMSPAARLQALANGTDTLVSRFGTWRTPWGEINRFQRLTDDLVHPFSDSAPSLAVGFTSGMWGSLASFGARSYGGSKKIYGTNGNSFVAVVEFGDSVRARAVTAGGLSGDVTSPHFNDQALRYSTGDLRTVYFYPNQLVGHTEREYRPGERR
jgi:acyl-homoserine-lactone acylase